MYITRTRCRRNWSGEVLVLCPKPSLHGETLASLFQSGSHIFNGKSLSDSVVIQTACSFPLFSPLSTPPPLPPILEVHSKWNHTKKLQWFSSLSARLSLFRTLFYYPHNILMAASGFPFVCAAFVQGVPAMEAVEKSFVFWNALILNQGVNCTELYSSAQFFSLSLNTIPCFSFLTVDRETHCRLFVPCFLLSPEHTKPYNM